MATMVLEIIGESLHSAKHSDHGQVTILVYDDILRSFLYEMSTCLIAEILAI